MYLESIFIGGDIRAQLPDEAKKFDNIDRIFRRASDRLESGRISVRVDSIVISVRVTVSV